jgi:TusA-related sulfurtransferase
MPAEKVDHRLDLIGKVCPYPTVRTSVTLRKMASGEVLEVITDYYPARQTIPDLTRELGYPCKLVDGEKPVFRFVIQENIEACKGGEVRRKTNTILFNHRSSVPQIAKKGVKKWERF